MTDLLVIGLDGMGYEAVRDNFDYLKQETFGKVVSDGIKLKTPPIWTSFLVGERETGINGFPHDEENESKMGKAGEHENDLYEELEDNDPDEVSDGGIGYRRDELVEDPWIEDYDYEVINFPIYNYTNDFGGIEDWQLYWGSKCLDGEISPKDLIKKFSKETGSILKETSRSIEEENDIVLSYLHNTDYICHILYMHHGMKEGVIRFWRIVENQVRQVVESADDDTLVLLLSDHGSSIGDVTYTEPGGHSPNGFYSFNKDIDVPEEIHITKFQEIIEEELT